MLLETLSLDNISMVNLLKHCKYSKFYYSHKFHTSVTLFETGSGDWINWLLTIVDNKKMVSSTVMFSLF